LESRYSTDKLILEQESEEQEKLVSRLREANASFLAGRRMDSSLKEREDAIQTLENAFMKYNELIGHLDGGRKFYNELTRLLSRYRDECKHFVYRRRVEAGQMEVYVFLFLQAMEADTDRPRKAISLARCII
jgi:programmed cell death 6-interacting protein